mgnify:CR=1 FL=1
MKENEWTGLILIVTFGMILGIILYGVGNARGYEAGYTDAKSGKSRFGAGPYYDTIGSLPDDFGDIFNDDYLNHSDKKQEGGKENGREIGTCYQDNGNKALQGRGEAESYIQPIESYKQRVVRNIQDMGRIYKIGVYLGLANT